MFSETEPLVRRSISTTRLLRATSLIKGIVYQKNQTVLADF